jgi:hypothetical protein
MQYSAVNFISHLTICIDVSLRDRAQLLPVRSRESLVSQHKLCAELEMSNWDEARGSCLREVLTKLGYPKFEFSFICAMRPLFQ